MPDLADSLANQTGLDPALVQRGLGAVLTFLKQHLGEETFGRLESAVPQTSGLMSSFESEKSSGGLVAMATDLAGKFLKGHSAEVSKLMTMLSQAGLSLDQIRAFLPKVLTFLEGHLPPELLDQIKSVVTGATNAAQAPSPQG